MPAARRLASFAASLVALALATPALAGTLRVPQDHATVQEAVDAAAPGDTILIRGTLRESVVVSGKTGIQIRGAGRGAVLEGGAEESALLVRNCQDVTVSLLTVRASAEAGIWIDDSTSVVVSRCKVLDATNDGIWLRDAVGCRVERTSVLRSGAFGIRVSASEDGGETRDCILRGNLVKETGASGVFVEGSRHQLTALRLDRTGGDGIETEGASSACTLRSNSVVRAGDDGIQLGGTGHTVVRNTSRSSEGDGVNVDGSKHALDSNRVQRAGDDGFETDADELVCTRNTVLVCEEDGFDIDGTGSLYERNQVTKAKEYGYEVNNGGNTLRLNRSVKSGTAGFFDDTDGTGGELTLVRNSFR